MIEAGDDGLRFLDRCWQVLQTSFFGPEFQSGNFLLSTTQLGVDLIADSALVALMLVISDELQAAGFTNAVFMGTMVFEVSPLPITTGENDALEIAHVSKSWGLSLYLH